MSAPEAPRVRDESIDLVRGIVMVLMALDHARDFYGGALGDPTDLATTTVPLFFTRWVTHFCAPVFVFLAGTAASLSGARRSRAGLARFLLSRGVWLVLLELTVVRLAWSFDPSFRRLTFQVIWAIGASMVLLSAMVFLPDALIAALGALLVVGHDAFDHVRWHNAAWTVLHAPGMVGSAEHAPRVFVLYPLVPWVGVMALGYAYGRWQRGDGEGVRRRRALALGLGATAAFVALRAWNVYGDPHPWTHPGRAGFAVLSFLDCAKYPPSLCYLLMTLGPSLALLGALPARAPGWTRPLLDYGRVPLFYYVLHLYALHAGAWLVARALHQRAPGHFAGPMLGLVGVYAAWIAVVVALYPACRWFAGIKATRRSAWLSYV